MRKEAMWLSAAGILLMGAYCTAANYSSHSAGLWNSPGTWDYSSRPGTTPGAADRAILGTDAAVTILGTDETIGRLLVGYPGPEDDRGPAYLSIMGGGSLHVEEELHLGRMTGCVGHVSVYDSSALTADCDIIVGAGAGHTGYLNVYGGNVTGAGLLDVGWSTGGHGGVNIYGGVVTVAQYYIPAYNRINLAGGILRWRNIDWETDDKVRNEIDDGRVVAYGGSQEVYFQVRNGFGELMAIPEPGSLLLLGVGAIGLMGRRRG